MRQSPRHWLGAILTLCLLFSWTACSRGPSDEEINAALKGRYFSDTQVKSEPIDIAVKDGEVTLAGQVSSDAARLKAYQLAIETPGVKKVNDQMQVGSPATAEVAPPVAEARAAPESAPPPPVEPKPVVKKAAPPPPRVVTVPAGTSVRIQMIDSVNSKQNQVGQTFAASLDAPIVVDETVVVPKGADVAVALTRAKASGKMKGSSELELQLTGIRAHGKSYPLASSSYQAVGASRGKQTAKRVGIGAAVGTAIGAIAGGGKGAAIGAGVGAGAGAAAQLLTHGKEVQVPSETKLDFQLAEPVSITLPAKKSAASS
jgi:BON domain/YMGG-like Gly-zipper